jgi:hypothetical protein
MVIKKTKTNKEPSAAVVFANAAKNKVFNSVKALGGGKIVFDKLTANSKNFSLEDEK